MRKQGPKVSDYMSKAPVTVDLETPLSEANSVMQQRDIRHLPVTKGKAVVGVVSDRDIRLVIGMKKLETQKLAVRWVYSPVPYKVAPSTPLVNVIKKMKARKLGSALVVEKGKLKGIFTVVDALEALSDLLSSS